MVAEPRSTRFLETHRRFREARSLVSWSRFFRTLPDGTGGTTSRVMLCGGNVTLIAEAFTGASASRWIVVPGVVSCQNGELGIVEKVSATQCRPGSCWRRLLRHPANVDSASTLAVAILMPHVMRANACGNMDGTPHNGAWLTPE